MERECIRGAFGISSSADDSDGSRYTGYGSAGSGSSAAFQRFNGTQQRIYALCEK